MIVAAVTAVTAAFPPSSHAQGAPPAIPLLDVPYLPQSEALCGGAAIAMVMRYWGVTGVYAETFADLVDTAAGGIRGLELVRALEGRGFDAASFEGDAVRIQSALSARRPPVALIEDRPGRLHYVVIVGWRGDRVIVHDPARAPFRVIPADKFVRAWSASTFWTLLAQPATPTPASASAVEASSLLVDTTKASRSEPAPHAIRSRGVCAGMVEEGIRLAGGGDLDGARNVLELSAAECDADPGPWRELAGLHALRNEWGLAAHNARRALDRDPNDHHAARILATSLFLEGDDAGALRAWNRFGTPVIDIVDIDGLERTRFSVAAAALDLPAQTVLTADRLTRARRRLGAVPSLMGSRVSYKPAEDDRTQVSASVLERPLVPSGLIPLAALGLRAVTDREVGVAIASPTGGGELWSASWRWWERRPRVELGIAAPSPIGGTWSVKAFTEHQTYGVAALETSERRRGVVLRLSDWVSGNLRIEAAGAVERWTDGLTASLEGGVEQVFAGGNAVAGLGVGIMTGAHRAGTLDASAGWRSTETRAGTVWQARAGFSTALSAAPLALWPGAGTGQGRSVLLRAHPLLDDGIVRGVFGRRLAHGGVEWRYWRGPIFRTLHLAPAVFVDAARAFRVPAFGDDRTHVDAGAGIRVALPGAGVLRVDLGRGLRDGEMALSFGWVR